MATLWRVFFVSQFYLRAALCPFLKRNSTGLCGIFVRNQIAERPASDHPADGRSVVVAPVVFISVVIKDSKKYPKIVWPMGLAGS